ncbi:MAG TPA: amidase [Verrucomicrobiae bacterium]|nr:amidase [Verrucomicrobiae bacterium]
MNRRDFLQIGAFSAAQVFASSSLGTSRGSDRVQVRDFRWDEVTIQELQRLFAAGKLTIERLVRNYLSRIEEIDRSGPRVNSIIELNPDALGIARSLDKERKSRGLRGPLHGIPVLLKDNIETHDRMMTTAGSLALAGSIASRDSFVAAQLRNAGAVILGKTNLSEWANFRSYRSTSGWSGRGGLTRNPYSLDRNTSGSSSGSAAAVAANLCAVAVGTETDGSIISPASYCGIVGLKPTVGLVSRSGIIPISASQDTAGPMARTVTDAAILLGALAARDDRDSATLSPENKIPRDYTIFLDPFGLRGTRVGVARQFFRARPERSSKIIESALLQLKSSGAELIDPVEIPSFGKFGDAEFQVMLYEFKDGLNRYLATFGSSASVKTLEELIAFNEAHAGTELRYFGQETFIRAQAKGPLSEKSYHDALEKCRRLSRAEGLDEALNKHQLDALVAPSGGPAHRTDFIYGDRDTGGSSSFAAIAGYPNITVPAGWLGGLPLGLSFFGRAWSEPILLKLAYSFEQATQTRQKPRFLHSVGEQN